jgi:predicted O-methyltransferase YrrM
MLYNLIVSDHLDIVGKIQPDKMNFILSFIKENKPKNCVEIGVWKGSSLFTIAEACKSYGGVVTGIDPWSFIELPNDIPFNPSLSNHIMNNVIVKQETLDSVYENLQNIINSNDLNSLIKLVRNTSENAVNSFEDESINFLHIDGNHNQENVSKDIINYLPKVKRNGYILMDDTDWPSVDKAIQNHLSSKTIVTNKSKQWTCFQKL